MPLPAQVPGRRADGPICQVVAYVVQELSCGIPDRLLVAVIVALLAVQVGVPAWQMQKPRPVRFGWQMYAGIAEPFSFRVVRVNGENEPVDIGDYLANHRGDIAVSSLIPLEVCARDREAVEVRYRVLPEESDRVYSCVR